MTHIDSEFTLFDSLIEAVKDFQQKSAERLLIITNALCYVYRRIYIQVHQEGMKRFRDKNEAL